MSNYRKQFTELSKKFRTAYPVVKNLNEAASTKSDTILFEGKFVKRKRIILMTVGCGMGTCVMCPFPAESNLKITDENLKKQFDNSFRFDNINNYEMITIFCNGNFFNDREISDNVREYIFTKIGNSKVSAVTVECLPQFITDEKIDLVTKHINGKKLQVFMGLQTSNDFIRKVAINTTCTKQSFEKAVKILLRNNHSPAAFLLIKSPFMYEYEVVDDVLNSLKYLDSIGVKNSTLCPTRISPNTFLHAIYKAGYYTPLWLWSVVDILIEYSKFGTGTPMVNTSELKTNINLDSICAIETNGYRSKMISAIEEYLFSRDISVLTSLDVKYKDIYNKILIESNYPQIPIEERIKKFVYEYNVENK